ncbi:MAG: hypothetical protein WBF81_02610 [Thermoplasmata archaeon]
MDAAMRSGGLASAIGLLLVCGALLVPGASGLADAHLAPASTPVAGNVTGPTVLAYSASQAYFINASGGPAFAANGTQVGNLTFYASVTGANTTDLTISPTEGNITNATAESVELTVGNATQVASILVEIASVYGTANVTLNITYSVNVVQPYVLTLNLIADSSVTVAAFNLTVQLDGTPVGTIAIPQLTPNEAYAASFQYATTGLSSGSHTFTVSLANEHGLVTFAGGATTYSASFDIPGPPPNYTLWYVAGAVAFFGAIFIFVTRVAARRRTPSRK